MLILTWKDRLKFLETWLAMIFLGVFPALLIRAFTDNPLLYGPDLSGALPYRVASVLWILIFTPLALVLPYGGWGLQYAMGEKARKDRNATKDTHFKCVRPKEWPAFENSLRRHVGI
jgi:hypothetical protein